MRGGRCVKVTVVGQIENDKTGLGKAINDVILHAEQSSKIESVQKIDITHNKRFLATLYRLIACNTDVFYFTPAGSLMGNLRDCVILLVMICRRKPIITHFHNSNFGRTLQRNKGLFWLNKALYKHVARIIILGKKHIQMFEGMDIPQEKFVISYNGVDSEIFVTPDQLILKHQQTPLNVVYFSNMITEKGYNTILEVAKLLEEDERFQFIFSGKFFDKQLEIQFMNEMSSIRNVTYYEGVYGEEKVKLLQRANFFVLPSYYPDETLPISMLEAIAAGAYIIVTDVGVISEVVNEQTTSFVNAQNSRQIQAVLLEKSSQLPELDYDIKYYKSNFENVCIQERIIDILVAESRV